MPVRNPDASRKSRKTRNKDTAELFAGLGSTQCGKKCALSDTDRNELIAMLSHKERPDALDLAPLVPEGSFIEKLLRFFKETDSSYALPLFQLISLTASFLTQGGASVYFDGLGKIRPILWTIALAPSGSAKTLATDKVAEILTPRHGKTQIRTLPTSTTDAQWIIDLSENNGAYWLQDEVGQYLNGVMRSQRLERVKPWMLDAYSNKTIGNRLKGEVNKLTIEDPHFTFLGLTVRETWQMNIDAPSMLDGFCQRFNYVIAPPRTDTDMFDFFLYFTGSHIEPWKTELRETWEALCAQEGALETYQVTPDVEPYIAGWWRGLRDTWGDGAVPGSFIRRIGFSVPRYLIVIHFLLGRSNRQIDIETAEIATKYAEFHMESALIMLREYGNAETANIQRVAGIRSAMRSDGAHRVTARDVQRKLSATQRKSLSTEKTKLILAALDSLDLEGTDMLAGGAHTRGAKADALFKRHKHIRDREKQRERWRNEKRLKAVRRRHSQRRLRNSGVHEVQDDLEEKFDDDCVVEFSEEKHARVL